VTKLWDIKTFNDTILQYELLGVSSGEWQLYGLSVAVSVVELAVGLLLLWDVRKGLLAATLVLLLFSGLLAISILRGLDIPCGCPLMMGDPQGGLKASLGINTWLFGGLYVLYLTIPRNPQKISTNPSSNTA
jgi:hypothetical protein